MVNGQIQYNPVKTYEDYESLKKFVRSSLGLKYDHSILNRFSFSQDGTGSEVEIGEKAGLTITDKTNTELTIVGAMSANDNDYDGCIVTLVYKTKFGTEKTATCIINVTDSTTETAFNDLATGLIPVTDFYECVSLSSSVEIKTGHSFGMGTTGELTYGVIQAEETEAVDEDLLGVGTIYGYYSNDAESYRDQLCYISYISNLGELKFGYVMTDDTDASTKIKVYQATLNSSGFLQDDWNIPNIITHVTPTEIPVRDFWRLRTLDIPVTPASGHNFQIGNSDGSVIYNCVEEDNYESYHSRYVCPENCDSWIAHILISNSIATTLPCYVTVYYTPNGETHEHKIILSVANNNIISIDPILQLKPGSEIKFTLLGNLGKNTFDIHILEATLK